MVDKRVEKESLNSVWFGNCLLAHKRTEHSSLWLWLIPAGIPCKHLIYEGSALSCSHFQHAR